MTQVRHIPYKKVFFDFCSVVWFGESFLFYYYFYEMFYSWSIQHIGPILTTTRLR